jgi:hypothetical protein
MHCVTILLHSPESDLWLLWMALVMSDFLGVSDLCVDGVLATCLARWWCHHQGFLHMLHGWFGITHMGIPTQSLLHAKMHVGFNVKFSLLLSDLNQNQNMLVNFSVTPQYQISWKSFLKLLHGDRWKRDRHGEAISDFFLNFYLWTCLKMHTPWCNMSRDHRYVESTDSKILHNYAIPFL